MKKLFILVFLIMTMIVLCTGTVHSEMININGGLVITNREITQNVILDDERFLMITEEIVDTIEAERLIIQEQINTKQSEIDAVISSNNKKNNISFNPYDLTQVSGITGNEMYNVLLGFSGGSLAQFAWVFVDCENTYDINAFFLAALVAQESGWGKSSRAVNQNNLTGYAVYNSYATGSTFNTKEDSIYATARLLRENYLNSNGKYYSGVSIWNVNTRYCLTEDGSSADYHWSNNISSIANSFKDYYHSNVKTLDEVPEMNINMDELLNKKREELITQITPNEGFIIK